MPRDLVSPQHQHQLYLRTPHNLSPETIDIQDSCRQTSLHSLIAQLTITITMLFNIFLALLSLVTSAVSEVDQILYHGEWTNPNSRRTYKDTWKSWERLERYERKIQTLETLSFYISSLTWYSWLQHSGTLTRGQTAPPSRLSNLSIHHKLALLH